MLDLDSPFHTPAQFQQRLTRFIDQWGKRYPSIRGSLPEYKWRYYQQYLNYPVQLRRMRYTTNWIERFNKEVRKTTQHVNSFPNPDAALNLIFMVTKQMEEKPIVYESQVFIPSNKKWRRSYLGSLRHRIIDTTGENRARGEVCLVFRTIHENPFYLQSHISITCGYNAHSMNARSIIVLRMTSS